MTTISSYKNRTSADSLAPGLAAEFTRTDNLVKIAAEEKASKFDAIAHITSSLVVCANSMPEGPLLNKIDNVLNFIQSEIISTAETHSDDDLPMADDADVEEDIPMADEADVDELNGSHTRSTSTWADEVDDAIDPKVEASPEVSQMVDMLVEKYSSGKNLNGLIKSFFDKAVAEGRTVSVRDEPTIRDACNLFIDQLVDKVHTVAEQIYKAHRVSEGELLAAKAAARVETMLQSRSENVLEMLFERLKKSPYNRRVVKVEDHLRKD